MTGVSVITCTIRPNNIETIFDNYARQIYEPKELIIVLNKSGTNLQKWRKIARKFKNVTVYKLHQSVSLGACLNFAISKAIHPVISKFDDDDYYAPTYLTQALHALKTTSASIIGKGSHSTYFEENNLLAVFRPNKQNKYTDHVGGGTLVFEKSLFPNISFPAQNIGEDIGFQQQCLQNGHQIYSTDHYNYVYIRRKNKQAHTWKAEDEELLQECEIIGYTEDYASYVNQ
ncbi:glycosyltransferase [Alkalihalobacillus macyae]|uniref:glycosyltransferase n=1 Tax=Guptibacillus hwajinpoensis TaxID=208199 RepID=UPI00273C6A31|nr:glycosyltransferase [Alkalihalobacillus macyae]MDP4552069.1 glycosyltransferase [Alkalihalobacillus macyae]